MDPSQILKMLGISGGAGALLVMAAFWVIRQAIPIFSKAKLDASSFGVAEELIKSLQEEKKNQAEEHKAALARADDALKSERERADATRKVLEETTAELYKVREELSKLTNENIRLIGKVEELQRQVTTLKEGER